jgi:hypothetical protein
MKNDYRTWTQPVVIGSGQRLAREGSGTTGLRLIDRQAFQRDVIVISYQPVDDDVDTAIFEGWKPASTGSISELAMAMLGVAPVRETDQER